jgi:hypothetical protein
MEGGMEGNCMRPRNAGCGLRGKFDQGVHRFADEDSLLKSQRRRIVDRHVLHMFAEVIRALRLAIRKSKLELEKASRTVKEAPQAES